MNKLIGHLIFFAFFLQPSAYGVNPDEFCRQSLFSETTWERHVPVSAAGGYFREVILAHYEGQTVREIRFEGASFVPNLKVVPLSQEDLYDVESDFETNIVTDALNEVLETSDDPPRVIPINERLLIAIEAVVDPHHPPSTQSVSRAKLDFERKDGILTIRDTADLDDPHQVAMQYPRAVVLLPQSLRGTLSGDGRVIQLHSHEAEIANTNVVPMEPVEELRPATTTLVSPAAQPLKAPAEPVDAPTEKTQTGPRVFTAEPVDALIEKTRIEPRVFTAEPVDPPTETTPARPRIFTAESTEPPPATGASDAPAAAAQPVPSPIIPEPVEPAPVAAHSEEIKPVVRVYRPVGTSDRPSTLDAETSAPSNTDPDVNADPAVKAGLSQPHAGVNESIPPSAPPAGLGAPAAGRTRIYSSSQRDFIVEGRKVFVSQDPPATASQQPGESPFQPRSYTMSTDGKIEPDASQNPETAPGQPRTYSPDEGDSRP